jgi:cobyrinic acid a,c-diamide synthase
MDFPRIMIAALILSIGLIAAWKECNKSIAPFKKGPDYIDTGWLALAADRPCYNLDTFLLETPHILQSFLTHTRKDDIAVIEGNRGLYDGIDLAGSTSTAELAKLLQTPVLLCVDCTKITRTMAAVISGLIQFDPDVMIKGVVLNRVAGSRHERILRENIEHYCGIPVLGAIPKLRNQIFPERHMGLVPTPEHDWAAESIDAAAQIAGEYIDLDAIYELIQDLPVIKPEARGQRTEDSNQKTEDRRQINSAEADRPKIGIIKDSAFQFYYPENIDALEAAGAEAVFISPLAEKTLPELDALYIGGGFPETHAKELAQNESFRKN